MKPTRQITMAITTTNLDDIHQAMDSMIMIVHGISPEAMIEIRIGYIEGDN